MTNNNHPITPPPELVRKWQLEIEYCSRRADREAFVAKVFQLGSDYELEACCEWMSMHTTWDADRLRTARRPKSSSLKDEVKQIIDCLVEGDCLNDEDETTLRRALEQLND